MTLVAVLAGSVLGRAVAAPIGVISKNGDVSAPVPAPKVAKALAKAASAQGVSVVLAPFARAKERWSRGVTLAERRRRLDHARALGSEGWNAYLAAEPEVSAARLSEALLVAGEVVDIDQGAQVYADLSLRHGAVLLKLGRALLAEEALGLAHALWPEREVSITSFAPDVVEAYERVARRQVAPVRMRVQAQPPAAEVLIDGRVAGRAPVDLTLPAGRHVVVIRAEGYTPHVQVVAAAVDAGEGTQRLAVELRPDPMAAAVVSGPAALAIGQSSASVRLTLSAVIDYGGLGGVVLAASIWSRGAPALLGQRCDGVPVRCSAVVEIGYGAPRDMPAAAAELWRALSEAPRSHEPVLLTDPRLMRPAAPPKRKMSAAHSVVMGPKPDGARCRACRNPWVWLGVGAAIAVVGGSVWLATQDEPGPTTVVIDPCEFGQCAP